jgi:two-component system capsular synthesis sensor histidine kinase RcsC
VRAAQSPDRLPALSEYAGLQQAQAADPDMREMAAAFGSVSMRLLRVLEGTFGLAGMDARSPALVPLNVGPAVETAAAFYRASAESRDLAYVVDAPDDFACAWADPQALAQIMDALLSNAVAHTARGGIRVRVAADDQRVFVEVQDTGVGVDASTLESALEGSEGGVVRPGGGLGLGLALARRLADRMGAELTGRSVPGQGSVFRLALRPAPHVGDSPGGDGVARTEPIGATA